MTADLERRYRRLLRLLPAGYRQAWEEDMVSTFLQSTEGGRSSRPSLAERLSVVALALRLRLAGPAAAPHRGVWRQAAYGVVLILLLYQALFATVLVAHMAGWFLWRPLENHFSDIGAWVGLVYWSGWIALYGFAARGWMTAARTLGLIQVGLVGVAIVIWSGGPNLADLTSLAWPMAWAIVVLAIPRGARPAHRLWLGAYLAGSLVLAPAVALSYAARDWGWLRVVDLTLLWRVALLAALVAVLAIPAFRRSPGWLLALAIVDGIFGIASMLSPYFPIHGPITGAERLTIMFDLILAGLGVACAVVGVRALRRLPQTEPGPA